jgi:hypothetical protein
VGWSAFYSAAVILNGDIVGRLLGKSSALAFYTGLFRIKPRFHKSDHDRFPHESSARRYAYELDFWPTQNSRKAAQLH